MLADMSERPGTLRAAAIVGAFTMLSRVLGFARDVFLAMALGAGALADAFFVAFKLPNFFRRMLAEGTLASAVIPVLAEVRKEGEEATWRYLNLVLLVLALALAALTLAGEAFMEGLLAAFAPGFVHDPERWPTALGLARITFPYLFLITIAAFFWAVQNACRRFALPAASPALLNLALIFAATVVAPVLGDAGRALAWGVIAGGVLQLVVQVPAMLRLGWRLTGGLARALPRLAQTGRLFLPALVSVAAVQLHVLVGTVLASFLPHGAVSALYYADRLVQLPLALFGIAMGTALLPALSELHRDGREAQARRELAGGIAWLSWITLPAAVGLAALAEPLVQVLFAHGRFTDADAARTAAALAAYALGLVAFSWTKALAAACYARKDAKAPMRYTLVSLAVNLAVALALMRPLGATGLALATSAAAWANALLLYRRAGRGAPLLPSADAGRILRALLASLGMLLVLEALLRFWPEPAGTAARAGWLLALVGAGAASFFALARLMGERIRLSRESRDARASA